MHKIEPHFQWRDYYTAENDEKSPFYGREYNEFYYEQTIYNYYIHPQWDEIGSPTLYAKLLYADYDENIAIIELLGEWNDLLHNDIKWFRRNVIDVLADNGICKYVIIGENVLNFHGDDDDYYEEWNENVRDEGGWICLLNFRAHVREEMSRHRLHNYMVYDPPFDAVNWRPYNPEHIVEVIEKSLVSLRMLR